MLGPVTFTLTGNASGTAVSSAIQLDYQKYGPTSVQTIVTSAPTYNVECSMSSMNTSSLMTWFSSLATGQTSNAFVLVPSGVVAVRVNLTTCSTQNAVTMTVIQSAA